MRRFVILEHDWPVLHYDLMLEQDGVLKTWRMPGKLNTSEMVLEQLPDHRMEYLNFEGTLTGDRGSVQRIAAGQYTRLVTNETTWNITVQGSIQGTLLLRHISGNQWLLTAEC